MRAGRAMVRAASLGATAVEVSFFEIKTLDFL